MKFFIQCWLCAVLLACPTSLAYSGGCGYTAVSYAKPTYVAPYVPQVATIYAIPVVQLFSVGPGVVYAPPPPPAAVVPAATVSPCDAKIAALAAELKAVRDENRAMMQQLLNGQRQAPQPQPQGQPIPQQQPAPQAAPQAKAGDLSWLTGANGCAGCHGGATPAKGLDYTQGLERLTPKQVLRTIKQINDDEMPPKDQKPYADRGLQGPHPRVTVEQKQALDAELQRLASK